LVQIVTPGEKELTLTQPGDYTVFYVRIPMMVMDDSDLIVMGHSGV